MSEADATQQPDAPQPAPFTMLTGAPDAMVCEGDVCFVPTVE